MTAKKRVAFALDRIWWRLWWVQKIACFFLGHEPIPSASWYIASAGNSCAYCLKDLGEV